MVLHKIKAFTLVELIVVITILAVLGTIAFVSFQGYAQTSRDSARISDLRSIEKVLGLYKIESGIFPLPDSGTGITFSGSTMWSQGTFGTTGYQAVKRMSNIPTDPLSGTEYTYSVTYSKNEFQLGATLEGSEYIQNKISDDYLRPIQNTYAGDKLGYSYISGEYNGQLIQKQIGGIFYILAIPTLINANMANTTVTSIVNNGSFAVKGTNNIAASYSGSTFNTLGGGNITAVNAGSMVLFSGNKSDLTGSNPSGRTTLLLNMQSAYSGTVSIAANPSSIGAMMAVDTNDAAASNSYTSIVVSNTLDANIVVSSAGPTVPGVRITQYCGGDITTNTRLFGSVYNGPMENPNRFFAGLRSDGSIYGWGRSVSPVPSGTGFVKIFNSAGTFTAQKADGSIVLWNQSTHSGVIPLLGTDTQKIFSNGRGWAGLKNDGRILSWRNSPFPINTPGGTGYVDIVGSYDRFTALHGDGSVASWELIAPPSVTPPPSMTFSPTPSGTNFIQIYATHGAFAGITDDGYVETWGIPNFGNTGSPTDAGFVSIVSSRTSFTGLKDDGSVVTWGMLSGLPFPTTGIFTKVIANYGMYLGIKDDGSVVTWGENYTGNSPTGTGFVDVYATQYAFTGIKADGSVVSWGKPSEFNGVPLSDTFESIYTTNSAFAGLKSDGTVKTWGESSYGGNVDPGLTDIVSIRSNRGAFVAFKSDGTMISWGERLSGGLPGSNNESQHFIHSEIVTDVNTVGTCE